MALALKHRANVHEFVRVAEDTGRVIERILGANFNPRQRAMMNLALSFNTTWRTLVCENGLKPEDAIGAMIDAISP